MSTHNETEHPLAQVAQPEPKPQTVFDEADRIVLATPCYGGQLHYDHMNAIMQSIASVSATFRQKDGTLVTDSLVAERLYLSNESHIDRGRNKLANQFMRKPYNWLLFVDADVVPPIDAIAALWLHGMRGNKLVCAPYAMKGVVPQFAVNVATGAKKEDSGLVEVINAGTGFMMIHRSVFDALEKNDRAEEYELGSNDPHFAECKTARQYFKSGVRKVKAGTVERKLWLSEDYMLCYEWQKCGGKVMMDYRLQLAHIGTISFPVGPREVAAACAEYRRIGHPELPEKPI